MNQSTSWKDFFQNWPREIPQRGVVVTRFNEQILFQSFLTKDTFLLLQRQTPDVVGARFVLLPYDTIDALKIVDAIPPKVFAATGFQAVPSRE